MTTPGRLGLDIAGAGPAGNEHQYAEDGTRRPGTPSGIRRNSLPSGRIRRMTEAGMEENGGAMRLVLAALVAAIVPVSGSMSRPALKYPTNHHLASFRRTWPFLPLEVRQACFMVYDRRHFTLSVLNEGQSRTIDFNKEISLPLLFNSKFNDRRKEQFFSEMGILLSSGLDISSAFKVIIEQEQKEFEKESRRSVRPNLRIQGGAQRIHSTNFPSVRSSTACP